MKAFKPALLIILGILAFVGVGSVYTLQETQQALILQFGKPARVEKAPGLHFKRPWIFEEPKIYDKRVKLYSDEAREVIAADQKRLIVDAFALYRIVDPLLFSQTGGQRRIDSRLSSIMDSRLREVLGSYPLSTLLTGERTKIMRQIRTNVNAEMQKFGVEVLDVRIMRADLPEENSQAIYQRMQTEREREAREIRAQGAEEAQRITATADKERTVLLANAEEKALILRGNGDAEAVKIFADAFGKDQEFFEFYRTLQAYQESFSGKDTRMILSPESEFMGLFRDSK